MVFLLLFKSFLSLPPFLFLIPGGFLSSFYVCYSILIEKEQLISLGVVGVGGGGGIVFVLHLNFSEYYKSTSLQIALVLVVEVAGVMAAVSSSKMLEARTEF